APSAAQPAQAAQPGARARVPGGDGGFRSDAVLRGGAHRSGKVGGGRVPGSAAAEPGRVAGRCPARHPAEAARGGRTMSHPRPLPDANLPPYSGGRKQMLAAAVVGVAGIALTLLGMALSPQKALLAYLIAYVYWLGLAIGAVTLVMANYSAGA